MLLLVVYEKLTLENREALYKHGSKWSLQQTLHIKNLRNNKEKKKRAKFGNLEKMLFGQLHS